MAAPPDSNSNTPVTSGVADAALGNWVDRLAPLPLRPYLRLARADRPIGAWLLFFPCSWSLALAEGTLGRAFPSVTALFLFAAGALVMRGAGCSYNDFVDRDFDAKVARTASRPIPSGQVTPKAALIFTGLLCGAGLLVLLQFNAFSIGLGIASLLLVAIYPFMKRWTFWPQAVLGLTFNWGALMGWASVNASLGLSPLLLYAGAVAWTIGYDTIYAHQDAEDDLMLGLKSTALKFGAATPSWVAGFYGIALVFWASAAASAGAGFVFFTILAAVAVQMAWQATTLDIHDGGNCLKRFRSNRDVGGAIFLALVLDMVWRNMAAV
jgi:4-hydroxybenzoate polyprenyltransferase